MKKKVALITGITGQDGSYLAELLLEKGYEVNGIKRRASSFNTQRIDHLYIDQYEKNVNFKLHYGDLTDSTNMIRIIQKIQPDEIYNLGAMSHVKVSFDSPEYVANVDGIGTLRILEAVRILGLEKKTKIYQASTSELYGGMAENKNEKVSMTKTLHSTRVHLMGQQKYMAFGLRKTTVKPTECSLVMVSSSTMNRHEEEKLS